MSEYVTLSKGSPDFRAYLLGTFSKTKRALPIHTLNVNSAKETVTFHVVEKNKIQRPSLLIRFFLTFRARSFLLVMAPLFLILTKNYVDRTLAYPETTFLAICGVMLAFIAVNLRNDFMDHMTGIDRVLDRSGSRSIQRGWLSANQVRWSANVFLVLSLLTAIPLIVVIPELLYLTGAALALGLWAQFKKQTSFKDRVGGEFSLFLLLGPLLTTGFQLAVNGKFEAESVWLGAVWGWLVVFMVHLKNFKNILASSQAGFTNTVNWLGFDRSRRLLVVWWSAFIVFNFIFHWYYAGVYWGWYMSITLVLCSFPFVNRLRKTTSPVGSEVLAAFRAGFQLFAITITLWVLECFWYLVN